MAEDVDGSPLVDFGRDALAELDLGPIRVVAHLHEKLVPLLDLRLPDEREQLRRRHTGGELDVIGQPGIPSAVVDKRVEHLVLEVPLRGVRHHAATRSPVTASAIRDCLCSAISVS